MCPSCASTWDPRCTNWITEVQLHPDNHKKAFLEVWYSVSGQQSNFSCVVSVTEREDVQIHIYIYLYLCHIWRGGWEGKLLVLASWLFGGCNTIDRAGYWVMEDGTLKTVGGGAREMLPGGKAFCVLRYKWRRLGITFRQWRSRS